MEMFLALTEEQAYESQRAAAVDCGMFAPPGKFGKYVPLKDSKDLAVEAAMQACCVRSVEVATAPSTWLVVQLTASAEQMMQSVYDAEISRDAQHGGWRWEGDMPLAAFSKDWCYYVIAPIGAAHPWLRCIKGCGRAAAPGYKTCCRTCKWSGGGGQHGPICELRESIPKGAA